MLKPGLSLALVLLWMLGAGRVAAEIIIDGDDDGACALVTFLPFTYEGRTGSSSTTSISGESARTNPGFSQMAAAVLAVDHFNARDTSVVPELSEISNCRISFDVTKSMFFDTQSTTHEAHLSFAAYTNEVGPPCAIAGPFNEIPAMGLSADATAYQIPLVAHRSFNYRLGNPRYNPFASTVYPDLLASSGSLTEFLFSKGRTDFVAIFYALTEIGLQRNEGVTLRFDSSNIRYKLYPFFPPTLVNVEYAERLIHTEVRKMREDGYRTIVVALEDPVSEIPLLADAAEEFEMNRGEHFWVFVGYFEESFAQQSSASEYANVTKLLSGSAFLTAAENHHLLDPDHPDGDGFLSSWKRQNATFVERVNSFNPIEEGQPGYFHANESFFQDYEPKFGSGFLYDSIMSIGMGACWAANATANGTVTGLAHLEGVRSVDFHGASDHVLIGTEYGAAPTFGRRESTVAMAVLNVLPKSPEGTVSAPFVISDAFQNGEWSELRPFVYRDGSTTPPLLLRDMPDQNYLSTSLRIFGLILMGFDVMASIFSITWVYIYREHRVLRAAQPQFLYVLLVGALVCSLAIVTIGFDESYNGWTTEQLSRTCMATPWLLTMGIIVIYGALFSKLWRVNKVLQAHRNKVLAHHVVWPFVLMLISAVVVLSIWTGLDPLVWTREETNKDTGESIGLCECENFAAFIAPLAIVIVIPMVLTGVMAWKTKDIDTAFSDSTWVFALFVVQMQVILVSAPVIAILRDVSTGGRYLGEAFIIWTFSTSTIVLIIVPKVFAKRASDNCLESPPTRGSAGGHVKVSGIDKADPSASSANSNSHLVEISSSRL